MSRFNSKSKLFNLHQLEQFKNRNQMKISSSLKIQLVIKSLNLDTKYEKDEFRNFIKHTLCHRTLVYKQVEGRGRICH